VAITDLPLFSMLRARMQWHQERQRLLSENVANADTPNFRPRDLTPLQFDRATPALTVIGLDRTTPGHFASLEASSSQFQNSRLGGFQVRTGGGGVNLEDEMIKVAANQMDYQAATTLYMRSMGLIKTALGKR
jgi:flagellar basal-body rod protein FlgB